MANYQGTAGNDAYHGTSGYDTIAGYDGNDRLWGEGGPDSIFGGRGKDIIRGGDGDDTLYGSLGGDRLFGGAGNDIFETIGARNHIYGGAGDDEVEFRSGGYRVGGSGDGGDGTDTIRFDGATFTADTGTVALTEFEHLSYGARLYATFGEDCAIDLSSLSSPTFASDTLQIFAADGTGRLTVTGGAERDEVTGGAGDDVLNGGAGDDRLIGFTGTDTLIGGAGNDTVEIRVAQAGGAIVSLAAGTARTGAEVDRLEGIENVTGTGFADRIDGDAAANRLDGGYGDDRLAGGAGDDVLIGGLGKDLLKGGRGADLFDVNLRDDAAIVGDTILDFSHKQHDRIDLSQLDADWTRDGTQHFRFIAGAAFSGSAGELRVSTADGDTALSADLDGDARADYTVVVSGMVDLNASDLILAPAESGIDDARWMLTAASSGSPLVHLA